MHVRVCTRMRGTAFSARGSSHDNPMGVSHRFRGIGFDCCYLDPADEDTGIHGVSQTYRAFSLSAVTTSVNLPNDCPSAFNGNYSSQFVKISIVFSRYLMILIFNLH